MYDASFDAGGARPWLWAIRIVAVLAVILASSALGQMPGAPVLQNAWATPGMVGALDIAGGSGGSVYAAAVSWTPGAGRFEVSGGVGYGTQTGARSSGVYGARVAVPFGGASSAIGFAAFAGIGGGGGSRLTSGPQLDSLSSTTEVPIGAAIGWRHAIGAAHGLSVFATPAYVFRSGGNGGNKGLARVGIGADFGITNALGVTVGGDLGQTRPRGFGGPSGALFGVGASYAFGRR